MGLLGSTAGLELEGSADVDRLAVAVRVGQRRDLVALDLIADAAAQGDVAADAVGTADIQRIAIRTGQRSYPILVTLATDCHPAGKLLEVVADPNHRRLTAADRRIEAGRLGDVAG